MTNPNCGYYMNHPMHGDYCTFASSTVREDICKTCPFYLTQEAPDDSDTT